MAFGVIFRVSELELARAFGDRALLAALPRDVNETLPVEVRYPDGSVRLEV